MKSLTIIILTLTTIFTLPAQNRVGGADIRGALIEERGDSLWVDIRLSVDGKTMNKCQAWTIIPALVSPDSAQVLNMPVTLINGKRKAQDYRRQVKFREQYRMANIPDVLIDKTPGNDTVFNITCSVPYELWMDQASLHIKQVLSSCAQVDQVFVLYNLGRVKLMPYEPYRPQLAVNFITPEKETKTLERKGSAFLDFEVGKSVIKPDFRRNPQELAKIDNVLSTVAYDRDFQISSINVHGYASPEGSWQLNDRLSRERSQALSDYISRKFGIPQGMMRVDNTPEDWEGFKEMVLHGEMDDKYRVLEIIDSEADPDLKERRLRALAGGRPFRYVLNELFPSLRRVEYTVAFTVKEYSLEEAGQIVGKNPEQLNHYELHILAQSYPEGSSEQQNAYDLITRMFPEDPVANINTAARLLQNGETAAAKRYLDRAGLENPDAANNLAVYYILTEQLELAVPLLNKALQNGITEAQQNINQMEIIQKDNSKKERYLKINNKE